MTRWGPIVATTCVLASLGGPGLVARQPDAADGIARLLLRMQQTMQTGMPEEYLNLVGSTANRDLALASAQALIDPGITRAVVRERDRAPLDGALPGDGYQLMAEVLTEYGDRARVATWRVDVRRLPGNPDEDQWVIVGQSQLSVIDGLFRLSINRARQFRARNLVVRAEDLEIRLGNGRVFVAETEAGPTAVVLLPGSGSTFSFHPSPETEREQVRLFAGADAVTDQYKEVFLRLNPGEFDQLFPAGTLTPETVDASALRRAEAVFRDEIGKSFSLDLGDLSRESWSLAPSGGDMLAELRTRKYRTLTYTRSSGEPEDISLFDRRRRRNISVYASKAAIARHGRFFNEDASAAYDITDYLVEATFNPDRQHIEGRTRLRLRPRENPLSTLTLKLADPLHVRSAFSPTFGRLLVLRVRNQNSVVINLPSPVPAGAEFAVTVEYDGVLPPVQVDREVLHVSPDQQDPFMYDVLGLPGETSLLYTTRSFWYAQSPVSDYAPALMRITVPENYAVLASGELAAGSPVDVPPKPGERQGSRQYVFAASQPLRYLACLISRFMRVQARVIDLTDVLSVPGPDGTPVSIRPVRPGVFYDALNLTTETNPRLQGRGRRFGETAEAIARYYAGLVGDSPYPSLTVGVIERDLPGGHSPAYLSVVHQPPPQSNYSWANDPAAFPNYPDFFIAHEIAHQWWGQAIGWQSYHEQWISEGFSQFFAALYARESRGEDVFQDVMQRMARFARAQAAQGPISLGYRLGHVKGDPRVFRSLVYNKAAVVLNQLRLLLGEEVFLRGVRRFYFDWRFRKASTAAVRQAFERESGQDLGTFFEQWIHSSRTPVVKFAWRRDDLGGELAVHLRFEQVGAAFDLAVPVTLRFADRTTREVIVPVRGRTAELRVPFTGSLRDVVVNASGTAIVDVY